MEIFLWFFFKKLLLLGLSIYSFAYSQAALPFFSLIPFPFSNLCQYESQCPLNHFYLATKFFLLFFYSKQLYYQCSNKCDRHFCVSLVILFEFVNCYSCIDFNFLFLLRRKLFVGGLSWATTDSKWEQSRNYHHDS